MTDAADLEKRLAFLEERTRSLALGAIRAADGLEDLETRLVRVESYVRGQRNIRRLEERER